MMMNYSQYRMTIRGDYQEYANFGTAKKENYEKIYEIQGDIVAALIECLDDYKEEGAFPPDKYICLSLAATTDYLGEAPDDKLKQIEEVQ